MKIEFLVTNKKKKFRAHDGGRGRVGNNRLLKSKTNTLGPRQSLTSFLMHLCMKPTPLQCARRKANQIFLVCLLIKYLQPSKYKNPQSPQLSPEASKVWFDFSSKSVTGSRVRPSLPFQMSPQGIRPGASATPSPHSGLTAGPATSLEGTCPNLRWSCGKG